MNSDFAETGSPGQKSPLLGKKKGQRLSIVRFFFD